ncbi:unnamed protein product [Durusdinium trenchii]|uniref:Uncharacterized protein n=1 Tax=Durusdinium trenchii TaxID=1381693 RepID=A0ABP0QAR1_9DINO
MGKKRIQTTTSTEAVRLAEDKDLGISHGPGPDGNKFDILMQEETDGVVAAEKISRILKKRGVCLCEANAPPELLSQAFDEAEVLWKAGEFGPPMQVFDSDSQFEAQLWQQVLYQDEQKVLWMSEEAASSKRRMDSLKLLSQNMLEFSRGLGDILAQDGAPRVSHQVRKAEGGGGFTGGAPSTHEGPWGGWQSFRLVVPWFGLLDPFMHYHAGVSPEEKLLFEAG